MFAKYCSLKGGNYFENNVPAYLELFTDIIFQLSWFHHPPEEHTWQRLHPRSEVGLKPRRITRRQI